MKATLVLPCDDLGRCTAELQVIFNPNLPTERGTIQTMERAFASDNALERISEITQALSDLQDLKGILGALTALVLVSRKTECFIRVEDGVETRRNIGYIVYRVNLGKVADLVYARGWSQERTARWKDG